MRLVLDTHIWIWSLTDPGQLTPKVALALEDRDNELWLSSMSVWEFLVLVRKNRLRLKGDPQRWLTDALSRITTAGGTDDACGRQGERAPATFCTRIPLIDSSRRPPVCSMQPSCTVTSDQRLIDAKEFDVLANR